jgi:predicted TPR repeat methyltransferase
LQLSGLLSCRVNAGVLWPHTSRREGAAPGGPGRKFPRQFRPGRIGRASVLCGASLGDSGATMTPTARYDGHADWYDRWNKPQAERNAPEVRELLGPGDGLCLDLGCGSGHYVDAMAATGRTVVGLDYSANQLRIARNRSRLVVQGDATVLPFADRTFSTRGHRVDLDRC